MTEERNHDLSASGGLVVIAHDATDQVITRLACTRSRTVMRAMRSAYSVLILKSGAVRVEVHYQEDPSSTYPGKPLAALSTDDLVPTRHQTL